MGVHTGRGGVRDGDYYGPAVNRAARLMAVAHGGQIVVSLATEELVCDDAGRCRACRTWVSTVFATLRAAERVFQVRAAGLMRATSLRCGRWRRSRGTCRCS